MDYKIEFSKKAKKQFKSLPKLFQERLAHHINALASNPRPRGSIQLSFYSGGYVYNAKA